MGAVRPILVVSGTPASGKSTFCRSLSKNGFYYFSLNGEDEEARTDDLQRRAWQEYQRLFQGESPERLLAPLRAAPGDPVVEWGFPPNDATFAIARSLRAAGARFVWFECPSDVARIR